MGALHIESFPVSILDESGREFLGTVMATSPEGAITGMRSQQSNRPGIYSVWNPEDPHGMPLVEVTI